MTVILDGNRIIGQVLREYEDGTAKVLMRGNREPVVIVLAEYQTAFIGMD
jgi:hypothetical protein